MITEIRVEVFSASNELFGDDEVKVGDPFSIRIAADLKALWDLERFDDLRMLRTFEGENLVLILRVSERPSIPRSSTRSFPVLIVKRSTALLVKPATRS